MSIIGMFTEISRFVSQHALQYLVWCVGWGWWGLGVLIQTGGIVNNLINHNGAGIALPFDVDIAPCIFLIFSFPPRLSDGNGCSFPEGRHSRTV